MGAYLMPEGRVHWRGLFAARASHSGSALSRSSVKRSVAGRANAHPALLAQLPGVADAATGSAAGDDTATGTVIAGAAAGT